MKINFLILLLVTLVQSACSSSPLGPDISDRDYSEDDSSVVSGQDPDSDGNVITAEGIANVGDGITETCSRTSGHDVFYSVSTVTLTYTCERDVGSVAMTGSPSWLDYTINTDTITFSGSPETGISNDTWSFTINSNPTNGDAAAITTQTLDATAITVTQTASLDIETNRDTEIGLNQETTLTASWDGAMADASLGASGITTDAHGLTYVADCTAATSSYVCSGTSTSSGSTLDGDLRFRWGYSAFDQGSYYVSTNSQLTVESGTADVSTASTSTFSVPAQSSGNIALTYEGTPTTLNPSAYYFSAAISATSTPTAPKVGVTYSTVDTATSSFYFKQVGIDRTDSPGGADDGLTESSDSRQSNNKTSLDFHVRSLSDGSWITMGHTENTDSKNDVYFTKVYASATAPSIATEVAVVTNTTSRSGKSLDMTKPFNDGGTTRVGFVTVDLQNSDRTYVGKANPAGTTKSTIIDDDRYDPNPGANAFYFDPSVGSNKIDHVQIRHTTESSVGRFYIAYREATDIKIQKIRSTYSSGYDESSATIASGVMNNDTMTNTNFNKISLALASVSGSTVAAVVYRNNTDTYCYFQRINQALSNVSTPVALSSESCYYPSIHFNSKSGKFIVTYSADNGSGEYYIGMKEVTLGASDTAGSEMVITSGMSVPAVKLATDYYADGDWMAVFYREFGQAPIKFHGYHVPGR